VRIDRDPAPLTGPTVGDIEHGMEQPLPQPTFSVRPLTTSGAAVIDNSFGGVESPNLIISAAGRIHAAVRFTAITDIVTPLMLQIVTTDGVLLAEKAITARAGETVEDYVSYVINSYVPDYLTTETIFTPPRTIVDRPLQPTLTDPALTVAPGAPLPSPSGDDTVRVRIVQLGATHDAWKLDALSCFDESIVWEFSVDDGETWVPAYGIRNFVNGILTFEDPGRFLKWRVTAYRENMNLTGLQVRPHYRGMTALRTTGHFRGPNVSTYDHEPPIQEDPEFNLWWKPVPRTWFLAGQGYPTLPVDGLNVSNEFSSFFGRSAVDDISGTLAEATTRQQVAGRTGTDTLTAPGDTATRSTVTTRSGSDALSAPTEDPNAVTTGSDPINQPPMHPL
jgi:hypothetical protein